MTSSNLQGTARFTFSRPFHAGIQVNGEGPHQAAAADTEVTAWRCAMMGWGYGMGGGWLVMTGLWVLLIAALVGLVVWIFPREPRRAGTGRTGFGTPRELLDERLARGEIDVETYRVLREELTRTEASPR